MSGRRFAVVCTGRRAGKTTAALRVREEVEQKALANWCAQLEQLVPALAMCFHVPNGGMRPQRVDKKTGKPFSVEAIKLRAMGAKKGVFDWFVDVPRGFGRMYSTTLGVNVPVATCSNWAHGLRIELKVGNNDLSPEQRTWRDRWLELGYAVHVCYSWVEAAHRIADYLAPRDGALVCLPTITPRHAAIIRGALPPLSAGVHTHAV